ncbi:uncharacterized protein [Cicer arietinum]|uniref:Uncharacterized protein LOC101502048 n=1 Tax=Cicer arietinum TaxID=3827 RepID=A0A3Q7XT31_CICAR|nr:uncharacterized protein LOC101502048 [Cicer arietinum]
MEDYKWILGTLFTCKEEFKEATTIYAIHNGRDLKFIKNDKLRVRVKCKEGCEWFAYCAKLPDEDTWQLRKLVDTHSCNREYKVKFMRSNWLGKRLYSIVKENSNIKITDISNKVHKKWNVGVSKINAFRARRVAIDMVDGSFREEYLRLYDYCHELLRLNPKSTVKLEVQATNSEVTDYVDRSLLPSFQRLYMCLNGCKESFLICRPIIGLDGCFLKGYYGGTILATVGRDPNDQMLPIVVAGLFPAMDELLPGVEQRFCVRHLYNNFRKMYLGKKLKELMWKATKSTYPPQWEREMKELRKVNEEAYKYLVKIPPRFWSKSRFSFNSKCDVLVNNMSETFNSVIIGPRGKTIVTMLKDIKLYLMERYVGENIFGVSNINHTGDKFVVSLENRECSCRKWMLIGIPYCHAVCCCNFIKKDPEDLISTYYRRETYAACYRPIIYPKNGQNVWAQTPYPYVLPPPSRRLPRRPKRSTNKDGDDKNRDSTMISRKGMSSKCTNCKQPGHNKASCPSQTQESQTQTEVCQAQTKAVQAQSQVVQTQAQAQSQPIKTRGRPKKTNPHNLSNAEKDPGNYNLHKECRNAKPHESVTGMQSLLNL